MATTITTQLDQRAAPTYTVKVAADEAKVQALTATANGIAVTKRRESDADGVTLFDLSSFSLSAMSDTLPTDDHVAGDIATGAEAQGVDVHLAADGAGVLVTAIRGTWQDGETIDLSHKWLTSRKVVTKYVGYPLSVTAHGVAGGINAEIEVVDEDGTSLWRESASLPSLCNVQVLDVDQDGQPLRVGAELALFVTDTDSGDECTTVGGDDTVVVKVAEACETPLWVRWINRFGGVDHWMFHGRREEKVGGKVGEVVTPYPLQGVPTQRRAVGNTATLTVTAGAEHLTEEELDTLADLRTAAVVQAYDKGSERWRNVIVTDGDVVKDTGETRHAAEFVFDFPYYC